MQSSWTLSEAMTKEGRCSVVAGNGSLILGDTLAKELKTFAQVIELLESRGVVTDASTAVELCYKQNKKQKPFFGRSFARGFLPKGGHPLFLCRSDW